MSDDTYAAAVRAALATLGDDEPDPDELARRLTRAGELLRAAMREPGLGRPACATSSKIRFLSKHAATRALRKRNRRLNGRMHVYFCEDCHCWHIGHRYRS